MSYVCIGKKNDVLILHKKEQNKLIDKCETDAYKYKQACDTRLFRRHDQPGTTQARYIKGSKDVNVCYTKGTPCVLCETKLVQGSEDLQAQPELGAK